VRARGKIVQCNYIPLAVRVHDLDQAKRTVGVRDVTLEACEASSPAGATLFVNHEY
jgi:hypothetical protein